MKITLHAMLKFILCRSAEGRMTPSDPGGEAGIATGTKTGGRWRREPSSQGMASGQRAQSTQPCLRPKVVASMCLRKGQGPRVAPGECAVRAGEWAGRTGPRAVGKAWASGREMKAMGGQCVVMAICVLEASLCTCIPMFIEQYSR